MKYLLAVVVVGVLLVSAAHAEAKRPQPAPLALEGVECHVTPDPVDRWADVVISASGFVNHYTAGVVIRNEGGDVAATGMDITDGSGSVLYHTVWAGTNTVTVDLQATCSFVVEE